MTSQNLVLAGFMGTGKTTLGRLCAERLGYSFRDSDHLIVERAGRSIPEIFACEGEEAFRRRERTVIAELAAQTGQVIATGGGAILDKENAVRLRASGCVAVLRARPDTVLQRVGDVSTRPLLASHADPEARIAELMSLRAKGYTGELHLVFDTDHDDPHDLADTIVTEFTRFREQSRRRVVPVLLGPRSYEIHIEAGLLQNQEAASLIAAQTRCKQACIVTHPALQQRYARPLESHLRSLGVEAAAVTIPAGERYKNLRVVEKLYGAFIAAKLDRKSVVIAVGGGVLGDTVGFAAASYLRGIRFVQVPTTLLAQVDSSVGGKTGVDLAAGKNLVGAFHQPSLVLADPSSLSTLPLRELRSGLAEVIKYGIIYDKDFFDKICAETGLLLKRDAQALANAIARSCEIKAEVVSQDETEQGLRAILNFGHTIGHALEAVTHYRRYKHGEAIAIGMVSAALIGEEMEITPDRVTQRIACACTAAGLPTLFPDDVGTASILDAAQRDKKTEAGKLRFVLARSIGEVFIHSGVTAEAIETALARQRIRNFAHE